mmetsp:Transcript_1348/g.1981  ORF Transcript_1348/g.1981 Transcript_1348/m.1981 type:complete len:202 (+) Transcript_1348:863-1468(+)
MHIAPGHRPVAVGVDPRLCPPRVFPVVSTLAHRLLHLSPLHLEETLEVAHRRSFEVRHGAIDVRCRVCYLLHLFLLGQQGMSDQGAQEKGPFRRVFLLVNRREHRRHDGCCPGLEVTKYRPLRIGGRGARPEEPPVQHDGFCRGVRDLFGGGFWRVQLAHGMRDCDRGYPLLRDRVEAFQYLGIMIEKLGDAHARHEDPSG